MKPQPSRPSKKPGRPQAEDITVALKQAAARRIASDGYSRLSVDALAAEVGTTRPTFYRRFPSVAHLVLEILSETSGTGVDVNTGSLRADLLILQIDHVKLMSSPLVSKSLPALFEEMRTKPVVHDLYRDQFVLPRRAHVAQVIQAGIDRGEVGVSNVDIEAVCDMLNGPVIGRLLLPISAPLDDKFARQTVDSICAYLKVGYTANPA